MDNDVKWTKDMLMAGFISYFEEFGTYPTSEEIDRYTKLPSSRQIQRRFGGLVKLREELGLPDANMGKGANRTKIAFEIAKRGFEAERRIEKLLIDYFGEYFVHVEKPLDAERKYRADFFVYTNTRPFCIDVFVARDIKTLQRIINIKEKKYLHLNLEVIFVSGGNSSSIHSNSIERMIINKRNSNFQEYMKILTENDLMRYISSVYRPITLASNTNGRNGDTTSKSS